VAVGANHQVVERDEAGETVVSHDDCRLSWGAAPIVKDAECVRFLQWALPRLGLRWPGYRRVRGQVCKRIDRRIQALQLSGLGAYEAYVTEHAAEWTVLEALCSIPISRFYRDRAVFDALGDAILPDLAERASARGPAEVRCWSAGCASGEEPYTMSVVWDLHVRLQYPHISLVIVATDVDEHLLGRARTACYAKSSLRELPAAWIDQAFDRRNDLYCLRDRWRACVEFHHQDIRREQPAGEFDLILCRNVAFTYFSDAVQRIVLARIAERLKTDGFLVIGRHESLPTNVSSWAVTGTLGIYRRTSQGVTARPQHSAMGR
jgi:chemotaxis protein methyltransferase CheR